MQVREMANTIICGVVNVFIFLVVFMWVSPADFAAVGRSIGKVVVVT